MHAQSALIVDDSATARLMLARILKSMDIATRQAKSGEEAIRSAGANPPAMIFLDHLMPGLDGFETLRRLKDQASTANVPVIMYTSQNAAKYVEEAQSLGAVGVITKQVGRDDLYELVEKVLHEQVSGDFAAPLPDEEPRYDLNDTGSLESIDASSEYDLDVGDIEMAYPHQQALDTEALILRRALVTGANDLELGRSSAPSAPISLEQIANIEDNIKEAILTSVHTQDRALITRLKWISVAASVFAVVLLATLFTQARHIDSLETRTVALHQQVLAAEPTAELAQLAELKQRVQALALEHDRLDALEGSVGEMRLIMQEMIGILEAN